MIEKTHWCGYYYYRLCKTLYRRLFYISYELKHHIKGTSKENLLKYIRKVIKNYTFSYTRLVEMKSYCHTILIND